MSDRVYNESQSPMRAISLLATLLAAASVCAQTYPNKPIKLLVGYPPGGGGDFLSRLIADELTKELGVAVVVDNRPGAGGTIASEVASKAPADGYTVLNAVHYAINEALYK